MFPLVAMLVIIVAVLLRNDFHFEFSCHRVIISHFNDFCVIMGEIGYVNMGG